MDAIGDDCLEGAAADPALARPLLPTSRLPQSHDMLLPALNFESAAVKFATYRGVTNESGEYLALSGSGADEAPSTHGNTAGDIYASNNARVQIGNTYLTTLSQTTSQRQAQILKTLSTLPYRDRKDVNPRRVKGTCEWFLSHRLFTQWRDASSSAVLWVSADPGCGKSVLVKHLVDSELLSTKNQDTPAASRTTCYFFFKDGLEDQRTLQGALRCVLHQLLSRRRDLFSEDVLGRFETDQYLLRSSRDLWDVLLEIAEMPDAGEIMCLFDAFDECQEEGREEFYRLLEDFLDNTAHQGKLKVLFTSRPRSDIRIGLGGLPVVQLKGETEEEVDKITEEIQIVVDTEVDMLENKMALPLEYKGQLRNRLLAMRNRTYLWVHLTLDLIRRELALGKFQVLTGNLELPRTIEEAYNSMLARSPQPDEARKVLQLVLAASRPLTVDEIAVAMAVRKHHKNLQEVLVRDSENLGQHLRDLCGLLITIIDSKVFLLHQTARDFLVREAQPSNDAVGGTPLDWKHSVSMTEAHAGLAQACIWYLPLSDLKLAEDSPWISCPQHTTGRAWLDGRGPPFLEYATMNWSSHARISAYQDIESMLKLMDITPKKTRYVPPLWFMLYFTATDKFSSSEWFKWDNWTPCQVAAYCGALPALSWLLQHRDLGEVVTVLSSYDAAANAELRKQGWRDEASSDTISSSRKERDRDTDTDSTRSQNDDTDWKGICALSIAADRGFLDAAREVLRWFPPRLMKLLRVNPLEVRDGAGRTPLLSAVLNDHQEIADILLGHGARTDIRDNTGGTVLSYATCSDSTKMLNLLVQGQPHLDPPTVRTSLRHLACKAVLGEDSRVLQRILATDRLEFDTDIEKDIRRHWISPEVRLNEVPCPETLLDLAAYCGVGKAVVSVLIDKGADLARQGKAGLAPLHYAVLGGHLEMVRLLIDLGADLNMPTTGQQVVTELSNRLSLLQYLVKAGAPYPSHWDYVGDLIPNIFQLPLSRNSDPAGATFSHWIDNCFSVPSREALHALPLVLATVAGEVDYLSTMLDAIRREQDELPGFYSWSLLHCSARFESGVECLKLLQYEVDALARNKLGETALHLAVLAGKVDAVSLLLEADPRSINSTDCYGNTALHFATFWHASPNPELVETLLRHGADSEIKNASEETALHAALQMDECSTRDTLIDLFRRSRALRDAGKTS